MNEDRQIYRKKKKVGVTYQFEGFASDFFWQIKAQSLNRAAMILFKTEEQDRKTLFEKPSRLKLGKKKKRSSYMSVFDQGLMLAGFAIENLMKGLIIRKNNSIVSSGKLDGLLIKHDLIKLAKEAKLLLSKDEEDFCIAGTDYIMQHGRYPIGKTKDDVMGTLSLNNTLLVETYCALYRRINQTILDSYGPHFI